MRTIRARVLEFIITLLERILGSARDQLARASQPPRRADDDAPAAWRKHAKPLPPPEWVVKVANGAPHLLDNVDPRYVRKVLKTAHLQQIETLSEDHVPAQHPRPALTRRKLRFAKNFSRVRRRPPAHVDTPPHIDNPPPLHTDSAAPVSPHATPPIITKPAARTANGIRSVNRTVITEEPAIRQVISQPSAPAPVSQVRSATPRPIPLIVRETSAPPRAASAPRVIEGGDIPAHAAEISEVRRESPIPFETPEMRTHTPTPPETRDRITALITPPPEPVRIVDTRWASLPETENEDADVNISGDQQHYERITREQRGEDDDVWIE